MSFVNPTPDSELDAERSARSQSAQVPSNPMYGTTAVAIRSSTEVVVHVADFDTAKRIRDYISSLVTAPAHETVDGPQPGDPPTREASCGCVSWTDGISGMNAINWCPWHQQEIRRTHNPRAQKATAETRVSPAEDFWMRLLADVNTEPCRWPGLRNELRDWQRAVRDGSTSEKAGEQS